MTVLERVKKFLEKTPTAGRETISKALDIPPATVQRALKILRGGEVKPIENLSEEGSDTEKRLTSMSSKIRTLDDLLAYAEVDLKVWEVERFVVNKWDMGAKGPDGSILSQPLFQVKAWLRAKKQMAKMRDDLKDLIGLLKGAGPKGIATPRRSLSAIPQTLLEMSIYDLHLGKLCWAQETGRDYDTEIAEKTFVEASEALLERASGTKISKILFPIGNDFFNVDNAVGTTTAGTRQDEDGRYQRSFIRGRALMVKAIEKMRKIAPVDVIIVSGNHDTERSFYLGDVLSAWFHGAGDVSIDNTPRQRKYSHWGSCLLGFTHGNNEKHGNLPLIMATEMPEAWAATKFREFHVGHFHQKKEMHFTPIFESNSIRVRFIPSLCPPDAWHKSKGYEGLRAAEAFLWHKQEGNIGQFSFYPN